MIFKNTSFLYFYLRQPNKSNLHVVVTPISDFNLINIKG